MKTYKGDTDESIDHKRLLSRYLKYVNSTYLDTQDEPEALRHFTLAELKELRGLERENI